MSEFKYVPVEPTPEDDSIALDRLADYIADTWDMDKKYGLEEICQRLHAMWPGEFIAIEDLRKNDPNLREAVRALLTHWQRFLKSDGNQQDAYNLLVKGARTAWKFAEDELDRSAQPAQPSDTEMLDWLIEHEAIVRVFGDGSYECASIAGRYYAATPREAVKAAMSAEREGS